jgi:hypothetical protein
MAGKKAAPTPPAEPTARAPDLDVQAMERTLKQLWPSSVMLDVWERMREARRQAWAEYARSLLPRSCPGCGVSHSLAEVCR